MDILFSKVYLCEAAPRLESGVAPVVMDENAIWCPYCGRKVEEHEEAKLA